jgi:hypothetical protein
VDAAEVGMDFLNGGHESVRGIHRGVILCLCLASDQAGGAGESERSECGTAIHGASLARCFAVGTLNGPPLAARDSPFIHIDLSAE